MNQNRVPLYEALAQFHEKDPISFHVPGHKHGLLLKNDIHKFGSFLEFDVTELTGLDNLHSPEGPISEAHQLLADYYGTKKSYFLVNGSTVGNLAMVLAVFDEGDIVFVQRNCHKSILNAIMLAKVIPVFLSPEIDRDTFVPGGLDNSIVNDAYIRYPNAKGCILTYPNYYGMVNQIKEIIEMIHRNNGLALVDEAHGPHFHLGEPFPISSLDLGADIVVHSAHKMLPAMTMGSYLHINSERISLEKVELYLSSLQSSSPSYPIMASLDIARYFLANFNEEDLAHTLIQRNKFVDGIVNIKGLKVLGSSQVQDPLKVIIRLEGYSGFSLQQFLEEQGVFIEMADPYQVVFVLPLLKRETEYPYKEALERIETALSRIPDIKASRKPIIINNGEMVSQLAIQYNEMKNKQIEWVDLDQAINRVSAGMMTPYPPGIPHILSGEMITYEKIEQLKQLIFLKVKFQEDRHRLNERKIAVFVG